MMVYEDPGPKIILFLVQYKLTIGDDGGYMGMQTIPSDNNGNNLEKGFCLRFGSYETQILNPNVIVHMNTDGSPGKIFINAVCLGNGEKAYRFRIWKLNSDSGGVWW